MRKTAIGTALILALGLLSGTVSADPIKGEKLLIRATHGNCALPAPRIAMAHSQAEWKVIYENGQMEAEVAKLCNSKKEIKPFSQPYQKYSKFIFEYMEHYSNDSGAIPA